MGSSTPFVLFVVPSPQVIPLAVTEALPKIGSISEYHAAGYDGAGVKIAVLDIEYEGLQDRINEDELPANIKRDGIFRTVLTQILLQQEMAHTELPAQRSYMTLSP